MDLLPGFTAGLLLITLSELGDKTFFIGAILAMRHPRRWVFAGVTVALAVMTLISVWIGQLVAFFPQHYVGAITTALFIGLGLKLLYDAVKMSGNGGLAHEQADALSDVEAREQGVKIWSVRAVLVEAFTLTFLGEWGDRTQLATITLASANHPYGVFLGAVSGHLTCAAIAVVCGKFIAGRISEKLLTGISGALFICFGLLEVAKLT